MSKIKKIKTADIEELVMSKVKTHKITMKPAWYFTLGSFTMIFGLIGLSVTTIFLSNLSFFLLRQHGPMGEWKLNQMINNFPLWLPIVTVLGLAVGISLLKKYDFSYKKNFTLITLAFILTIIITGYLLDISGLNDTMMMRGPVRRFQQQKYGSINYFQNKMGQGRRFVE